jgi:hypothetical protein
MLDGGNRLGFALEARLQFGISRGQSLECGRAIQSCVARLVDSLKYPGGPGAFSDAGLSSAAVKQ